jgi:hypothetical protein
VSVEKVNRSILVTELLTAKYPVLGIAGVTLLLALEDVETPLEVSAVTVKV